jgi:hypothetical protein
MKTERPVAQVCLYGTRETGFAYLASGPELTSPILAQGGWSELDEAAPSGRVATLTEIVEHAKAALRALGVERGQVLVCFPGGRQCARTPIDQFQSAGSMTLEPAPLVAITKEAIKKAARRLEEPLAPIAAGVRSTPTPTQRFPKSATSTKRAPAKRSRATPAPLGLTTNGKLVPRVPPRLGALEKAASQAAGEHGLFDDKAQPAIHAAQSAENKHFEAYAKDFTVGDHRDAAQLLRAAFNPDDRYLNYARNGLVTRHERAIEALEEAARREALSR